MEEINVAELLKDCPSGMELNCTMFENVKFDYIKEDTDFPIKCFIENESSPVSFNKYGKFNTHNKAKCVIFPKSKTTWEGFVPPCKFKDGDIVINKSNYGNWIGIFHNHCYEDEEDTFSCYCYLGRDGSFSNVSKAHCYLGTCLATEEEKQKLFYTIKENGYRWNPETKTLEKIEPNFHEGDWVIDKQGLVHQIKNVVENVTNHTFGYDIVGGGYFNDNSDVRLWTIQDSKDGDVLFHSDSASNGIFIFKEISQRGTMQKVICYCDYDSEDGFCLGENHTCCWTDSKILHPATKEQRDLLFQKIKEAGYKWDTETKTLEKLIEPKFKVGDKVKCIFNNCQYIITELTDTHYTLVEVIDKFQYTEPIIEDKNWELVPNKFDINTLVPFESKVLVRDGLSSKWLPAIWGFYDEDGCDYHYQVVGGYSFNYCIPYEANKELLGTTKDCDDFYKTW